uniref:Uncharacterized protein n=1 Tax=Arundo donax TaxID=35708 RepID=A0A0A9HCT7_ARUDO
MAVATAAREWARGGSACGRRRPSSGTKRAAGSGEVVP